MFIDYLANNMWTVWAVVALLGLILELSSGDFFIICFAIGALASVVVSFFTNIYIQLLVFSVVTALCIFFVRPFALRYLHKGEDQRVSNGDALTDKVGFVTEAIAAGGYGRVSVGGDDWKAVASDQQPIAVGTRVKVVSIDSIIITVVKC